jgi:hypothetical protein
MKRLLMYIIVIGCFFVFTNEGKPQDCYYVAVTFENGETHYISSKIVKKQGELMDVIEYNRDKQKTIAEYLEWERTVR